MSDQGRPGEPGNEPQIKVVDRRRFRPDGSEVPAEPATARGAPAADPPPTDDRDVRLAAQAARIDELTRAYAALVEEQKAFRQRAERERVRVIEAERAGVAQALLEAADDLERALAAALHAAGGPAQAGLLEGVKLSLAGLTKRIGELGAERIAVAGQRFDPRVAEAVDAVTVADPEQDGVVVQEVRAGYRIGDRVLRPARVRVGRLARA